MDQGPTPLASALPGDRKSFIGKKADMVNIRLGKGRRPEEDSREGPPLAESGPCRNRDRSSRYRGHERRIRRMPGPTWTNAGPAERNDREVSEMKTIWLAVYIFYSGGLLLAQLANSLRDGVDPARRQRQNILDLFLRTGSLVVLPLIWITLAEPVCAPWKIVIWAFAAGIVEICRFFAAVYVPCRRAPEDPDLAKRAVKESRDSLLALLILLAAGLGFFLRQYGG